MIELQYTEKDGLVSFWGHSADLREINQILHNITLNSPFILHEDSPVLLGLAYDIRKAYQNDRLSKLSEDYVYPHEDSKKTIMYGFTIPLITLIFYVSMLKHPKLFKFSPSKLEQSIILKIDYLLDDIIIPFFSKEPLMYIEAAIKDIQQASFEQAEDILQYIAQCESDKTIGISDLSCAVALGITKSLD